MPASSSFLTLSLTLSVTLHISFPANEPWAAARSLGRLACGWQPYPLTPNSLPPTLPLGAPALSPVPLPTPHSGVSTCGSLATAAVADYQGMVAIRPFAAIHACVTWRVCMPALDHPKIAKAAWLPLSILGVKETYTPNSSTGSALTQSSLSLIFFCLFNLHQQVCYSSSNAPVLYFLSSIIHLSYCNIFFLWEE